MVTMRNATPVHQRSKVRKNTMAATMAVRIQ
jgi:hypothetical protein